MLNTVIRFSLRHRMLVIAAAMLALGFGGYQLFHLPIDVFPDLNRPRVTVLADVVGMAPEEIESQITIPLESALNGAAGVEVVRSSSSDGIAAINVEFAWGTDPYVDRNIVNERISQVRERLPKGVHVELAPMSSIMGQIAIAGLVSRPNEQSLLFDLPPDLVASLDARQFSSALRQALADHDQRLSTDVEVRPDGPQAWNIVDRSDDRWWAIARRDDRLQVHKVTSPMQIRTLADWLVRQRLLTIPGVAQVIVMGGGRKQYQVLVDPDQLLEFGVTIADVRQAVEQANANVTGGYLDDQGPDEYLVRGLGRIQSTDDLEEVVVTLRENRPVLLRQVADVIEAPQVKRGDGAAYALDGGGRFQGGDAVLLTINKQPQADTRLVTDRVTEALDELQGSLPADVLIEPNLYQQKQFIDLGVSNVAEALLHGGILVVIVLFIFLLNFRTTFITLTAIPLSIVTTGLVFHWFGMSINTMTLGGLAVAIGELVDDAIVDVENIFRRLRENARAGAPKSTLLVVFQASAEVRNSIVFGTAIVVVVFIPLFALGGMEGRLFTPLGIAYIVSILSSLLVSLTVTPVLSYWLLPGARVMAHERDSLVLRASKALAGRMIQLSLRHPAPILGGAALAVVAAVVVWTQLERDFLPPFNEGSVQVNLTLPPGTSLERSRDVAQIVEDRLQQVEGITAIVSKTGRAEMDEHVAGVNRTETIATFDPETHRSREEIIADIRKILAEDVQGASSSVEQPISHLMSHMLSGVKAQIGIKIYGDDLDVLRRAAGEVKQAIRDVPGVTDLFVDPQTIIPQLRIERRPEELARNGLTVDDVYDVIETAMNGQVVSTVIDGQRSFDLVVRMKESAREDVGNLHRLAIDLPGGGRIPLGEVAHVYLAGGPNGIYRENVQRQITIQCNTTGRGLVDVVEDIRAKVRPIADRLPTGYYVQYGGQFESQQSASRLLLALSCLSLFGMFLLLYTMFRSANFALQVMMALPMALIGSVAALVITGQTLSVAALVGFISLCGIASRNGILLLNHYLHLVRFEGEGWTHAMIVRAGKERLAPVLMTALTSGIGLVPLALAAGEPGKEILYPVATVIIGGLFSSTLLEFLVRPGLFWLTSRQAGERLTSQSRREVPLVDEEEEGTPREAVLVGKS